MSVIKDISESHQAIKAFLIWLLVVPFWYISLFLFNKDFFDENSLTTLLAFSICFSLVGNVLIDLIMTMQHNVELLSSEETIQNTEEEIDFIRPAAKTVLYQTLWLSILVFIFYTIDYFFCWKIKFYPFLLICFLPLVVLYILWEAKFKRRKKRYGK